jgi:hypothetical protein
MPATTEQLIERFLALPPYQQRRLAIKHADVIRADDFLLHKQLRALHQQRETPTGLTERRRHFVWLRRCQEWALSAEERHRKLVAKQLRLLKSKLRRLHAREAAQQRALDAVRRRLERLQARADSAAPARQRRSAPAPVAPPPPPRPLTVAERMAAAWDRTREEVAA